jgi:hypothetical protein
MIKKVFGIFHYEYGQNKEFEKLYMQNFDSDGNFITWGKHDEGKGRFSHQHVVSIDTKENVYASAEHWYIQKL